MDIKTVGLAAVASLCDVVAEIMTDQPTNDEKAAVMAKVEGVASEKDGR